MPWFLLDAVPPLHPKYYILAFSFGAALFVIAWFAIQAIFDFLQRAREFEGEVMLESRALRAIYPLIHSVSGMFRGLPLGILERYRPRLRNLAIAGGLGDDLDGDDVYALMLVGGGLAAVYGFFLGTMLDFPLEACIMTFGTQGFLLGALLPLIWLRDRKSRRQRLIRRGLPYALDLLTLAVEAGLDFTAALNRIAEKQRDTPLALEFRQVTREILMGKRRTEALKAMASRIQIDEVVSVVSSLVQADELGSPLGPILRIQGEEIRTRRFQEAEKKAMEAPVKLLFPLIAFIMPQVFIMLFAPMVLKIIREGGFF